MAHSAAFMAHSAALQTVLISGGSGLVGTQLSKLLLQKGYKVTHLSRSSKPAFDSRIQVYKWHPSAHNMPLEAVAEADYIINLAGESVASGRWTDDRKQRILKSRIDSVCTFRVVLQTLEKQGKPAPKAFITASAVGIYGSHEGVTKPFTETAKPATDFLAEVTQKWEAAADALEPYTNRVVKLRIGVVLSKEGGALEKMLPPARLGLSAVVGSGKQGMSWIHIDDLCGMFLYAIEQSGLKGTYNAVAPQPASNEAFTKTMAQVIRRPAFLSVPGFALKLAMGEMADIVTAGSYVSSQKIEEAGFHFDFPELKPAFKNLLD